LVNPIGEIFSFGGLAFYGGFIVGFIAVALYIRKYNINLIHAADIAAVVLSISYAVGRIGCQLSGDGCWGIVNTAPKPKWLSWLPDWAWSFDYPHNVLGAGAASPKWHIFVEKIPGCTGPYCYKLATPVFPTPLYEMTIMFIVFLILWSLRKKMKLPGNLFALYLILAGTERFFIEFIRHTNRYHFLGIAATQAQIISVIMFIAGVAWFIYAPRHKDKVLKWASTKPKPINFPPKDVDEVIED
jgi:prolipoprotein diacylglyceryl transferase